MDFFLGRCLTLLITSKTFNMSDPNGMVMMESQAILHGHLSDGKSSKKMMEHLQKR